MMAAIVCYSIGMTNKGTGLLHTRKIAIKEGRSLLTARFIVTTMRLLCPA